MSDTSEKRRLETLHSIGVLDTLPEKAYDDLVKLAVAICGTSIGAITLIDENRQWFKSIMGLEGTELPRDIAFCDHTIRTREVMHIPDAREDDRFKNNPLVLGDPNLRFYAGAPLIYSDGSQLGALCVLDSKPLSLSKVQIEALEILARQVISQLELSDKVKALRSSETVLREQQNFMSLVSDNLPGVIYKAKQEGGASFRFQYMSRGAEKLFGVAVENIIGKASFSKDSVHPSDRDSFLKAITESTQNGTTFRWEGKIQTAGKVQNWIRVTAKPQLTQEGILWFGIIFDINEAKVMESELQTQHDKLAETSKLLSFARLSSSLAREISNPLAIIKGMTSLLKKARDDGSANEEGSVVMLDALGGSVDRIENIVENLERLSTTDTAESFRSFELHQIIGDAIATTKALIAEVGLEIELHLSPVVLKRCRPIVLSQVMHEIIENACEAEFKSTRKLVISASFLKGWVQLRFQDSGQGIAKEVSPYVFDPFFTTKQLGVGRGLGLSRARAIVDAHGGTLVYDDSNFSSTFVLTLPHAALSEAA